MNEDDLRTEEASAEDCRDPYGSWDTIPWDRVETHVSRLQTRIAVAEREGRGEDVRRLQRMLTGSFDAKLLAVRTVTTNRGKNTPGVDMVTWDTPDSKLEAARSLASRGYRAKPLRRVRIPKKKPGQTRPLGIPTMYDRAMQALWAMALDPVAEVRADRNSFGFRKGRCPQDAHQRLFNLLCRKDSPEWVLEGDIRGCFDNISHEWLMENVPMDKAVMAQFLKAGFMELGTWHPTVAGTPQGGGISAVYCNLALDGMEDLLARHFTLGGTGRRDARKAGRSKVHAVRFADDFVVTASSPEVAEEARRLLVPFLSERGLELSAEKTLVTSMADGFDFLSWNFRKYRGKLLTKPSKDAVRSFLRETHRVILREGRGMCAEELVRVLTPKVRGFAGYHLHTCASEAFAHIAYVMWLQLRRWASRRHPRKGARWVARRYWHRAGGNQNVFSTGGCLLAPITWHHVVRHVALRTDMNPYVDRPYFEARRAMLRERRSKSFHMPAAVT